MVMTILTIDQTPDWSWLADHIGYDRYAFGGLPNTQKRAYKYSIFIKENNIYFLVYDTKNNARASVKHIYDMALTLKNNGGNVKILVEDNTYTGVSAWLGEEYDVLPVVSIKEDKIEISIDDVIVVPEYYSNVLQPKTFTICGVELKSFSLGFK